ncbi:hypothetical protein ABIH81_12150 [Micromonospora sp. HUAS YX12]|uniref:Uncharacterized protein n=1 Tax=Micromonospora sp. HUAS YX12 TaxID=3156396 RepID=A0AAU7R9W4_9ACTN
MNVRVTNNWCYSSSTPRYQDTLTDCVDYVGSSTKWPADFELPPGKTTASYPKYYDTDAVRIYRGCKVWMLEEVTGLYEVWDRRGEVTSMWKKIVNSERWNVYQIQCG